MKKERLERFKEVVRNRQFDLTVILENVHDAHNIGAVLRSCESVGIREIFVLYTEPQLSPDHIALGKRTSAGARRWVDVHYYTDIQACFEHVKRDYKRIFSTHLAEESVSLYELDLAKSAALLFGNERDGLSKEALAYSDGNFLIPQMGFVQNLNISVACAVSLYEGFRQRMKAGMYGKAGRKEKQQRDALLAEYIKRHETGEKPRKARKIDPS